MSLSGVTMSPGVQVMTSSSSAGGTNTRAADGDYKVKSALTSQTKDADGDYKAAASSPAARSASSVQSILSNLKLGG